MHVEQYDSKPFLFSHAGVHTSWIKKYVKQKHSIEAAIEYLTISPVKKFRRRLNYLTIERGFSLRDGDHVFGFIWMIG